MLPMGSDCPANRRARVGLGFLLLELAVGGHVTILAICLSPAPRIGVFRLLS